MAYVIQLLSRRHDRSAFDCGEAALNEYLQRYARQNQERGIGRTFVAVPENELRVVGFYTLVAGAVAFENVPEEVRRQLPRYPVPVAHLGRLGVCRSAQGQGLGEALLTDALQRVLGLADDLGIFAVEARAKSERARGFYERYGFASLLDNQPHMYLPLKTIRDALG
jgi:ribosomal protein S18 acetylase RimI-like enzyme